MINSRNPQQLFRKLVKYLSDRSYRVLVTGNLYNYGKYQINKLSPRTILQYCGNRFYRRDITYKIICMTRQGPLLHVREQIQQNRIAYKIYEYFRIFFNKIRVLEHAKLIEDTKIFSKPFYEQQCGRRFVTQRNAIIHFLVMNGHKKSPHPLFNTALYLEMYPALNKYYHAPIVHYLSYGFREGYVPHPAFDAHHYCTQPWFNPAYPMSPLQHYLENACTNLDINPNKYFNTRKYVAKNPDCMIRNSTPLEHWVNNDADLMPGVDASRDAFVSGKQGWDVILVSHEASRTGAPTVVLHLAQYFKETLGWRCLIISQRGGVLEDKFLKYADLVILEHHWKNGCSCKAIAELFKKKIDRFPRYVIVNSAESYRSMEALFLLDVSFVLLMHEFGVSYPHWYLQNISKWPSHIIFPAEIVKKSTEKKLKISSLQASIKPQGYPIDDLKNRHWQADRNEVCDELNISNDTFIFLGCGTVMPRKGCDFFIEIAHHYRDMGLKVPFLFVWIGDPIEPRDRSFYMKELDKKIDDLHLGDNVQFIGSRSEINKYFHAADVFLLTSRLDPFPYVAMHAMNANLPVLCFDETTGVDKLFRDGRAGRTVAQFDTQAVAEELRQYTEDPKLRIKSGERARQLLEKNFSYDDYACYIMNICEKMKKEATR